MDSLDKIIEKKFRRIIKIIRSAAKKGEQEMIELLRSSFGDETLKLCRDFVSKQASGCLSGSLDDDARDIFPTAFLPRGTIFHDVDSYNTETFVIQQSPCVRTVNMSEDLFAEEDHKKNSTFFHLAFPYVIFVIRVTPCGSQEMCAYASRKPITALVDHEIYRINLPNISGGEVCTGRIDFPSDCITASDKVSWMITSFWGSQFNTDLSSTFYDIRRECKYFGSLTWWERESKKNPLFVLGDEVPWPSLGVLGDRPALRSNTYQLRSQRLADVLNVFISEFEGVFSSVMKRVPSSADLAKESSLVKSVHGRVLKRFTKSLSEFSKELGLGPITLVEGARVTIRKRSEYYLDQQPRTLLGRLIPGVVRRARGCDCGNCYSYEVEFENGYQNTYRSSDLALCDSPYGSKKVEAKDIRIPTKRDALNMIGSIAHSLFDSAVSYSVPRMGYPGKLRDFLSDEMLQSIDFSKCKLSVFDEFFKKSGRFFPKGIRVFSQKGNSRVFIVEQEPRVRQLSFDGSFPELSSSGGKFELALPYVIFVVKMYGRKLINLWVHYSNVPLTSIENHTYYPSLTNIDKTHKVVMEFPEFDEDTRRNPHLLVQAAIDAFWSHTFTNKNSTGYTNIQKEKGFSSLLEWEEMGKKNPDLVLTTRWQIAKQKLEKLERALLRVKSVKRQRRSKVSNEDVSNFLMEILCVHARHEESRLVESMRSNMEDALSLPFVRGAFIEVVGQNYSRSGDFHGPLEK